jgi:DNA-binding CsgD family transcriptional regulator
VSELKSVSTAVSLDSLRLLFDLQQGNAIAQSLSGCWEPEAIAQRLTDGLVEKFGCAFARLWLVEPNRTELRLVASSGMYTRLDGDFARVKMGAFKVGKIAQHCIPFLSNNLAAELWVKDRQWAIDHQILGFAGYPLVTNGGEIPEQGRRVVGVLAVFSQQALGSEFLEVLQGLCTTVTIVLENALSFQQEKQAWLINQAPLQAPLSEQMGRILSNARLTLIGTETPLTTSLNCLFLKTAEILQRFSCIYCRLAYTSAQISLEVMVSIKSAKLEKVIESAFGELLFGVTCLGGTLEITPGIEQQICQVFLQIPNLPDVVTSSNSASLSNSFNSPSELRLRIKCTSPVLQMAFTHMAYLAGLTLEFSADSIAPLLTDDLTLQLNPEIPVLWIASQEQAVLPTQNCQAQLDLQTTPEQLRAAVATVVRGGTWGETTFTPPTMVISEREREIMILLASGLRDRDIAQQLFISESTVKFHLNNVQVKLKAKTRYQALHQATIQGLLGTNSHLCKQVKP